MTLPFRAPGPLGIAPNTGGGRPPGPLGFAPGVYLTPNSTAGATKKPSAPKRLKMPPPAADSVTKVARDLKWSLFTGDGSPALNDVKQGALANCPLASLLAALAFTSSGQRYLLSLVNEQKATVETDLSAVAKDLEEAPGSNKIITDRYFAVTLERQAFEVSGVLYTDEARDPNPIYMTSPNQALWPCAIEKALAAKVGGYNEVDDSSKLTANRIWEIVMAAKPDGFDVTDQTPHAKLLEVAKNAKRVPTIAASKDDATDVSGWHGFAVLGMKEKQIELYDPSAAKRKLLSLPTFIKNFKAVLHGKS
ncbi:MAG: hypothetical protein JNM60_01270 [Candidatus Competibacteraceae bacterium]|nr:hypothetical protein [Candidatus Competibacteraceae bacterium]